MTMAYPRHSGARVSANLRCAIAHRGISRFQVWSFGPSRNDFENLSGRKTMQRTKAPFRADEVGSLLRPPKIKEARARLEKGEILAADLRKVEDMEIEKIVHKQASIGLKLATDGEFRRS